MNELNLIDGIFHGLVFSVPFSAPLIICISRFLIQGISPGIFALLGTLFGQLCFFFFICSPFRTLVSIWYSLEPFLAFFGSILAFGFATNFWSEGGLSLRRNAANQNFNIFGFSPPFLQNLPMELDRGFGKIRIPTSMQGNLLIFGFHFLLMFLNPAMPATGSRILLSSPFIFQQEYFAYSLGFLGMSILSLGIFWPFVFSFTIQLIQKGSFLQRLNPSWASENANLSNSKERAKSFDFSFDLKPSPKASRFLSFLIIGCVLSGSLQYSWRLFTQYPFEGLLSPRPVMTVNVTTGSGNEPQSQTKNTQPLLREFPPFDSNIRHREKNLPIDRFLPIEKMNARRILSDKPPLSEEQKSDAYFKFHSFFFNSVEKFFDQKMISSRLLNSQKRDFLQIQYLQQLKKHFQENFDGKNRGEPLLARPIENNTKGKRPQGFSYIRDFVSNQSNDNYMHDELQIYRALFATK